MLREFVAAHAGNEVRAFDFVLELARVQRMRSSNRLGLAWKIVYGAAEKLNIDQGLAAFRLACSQY